MSEAPPENRLQLTAGNLSWGMKKLLVFLSVSFSVVKQCVLCKGYDRLLENLFVTVKKEVSEVDFTVHTVQRPLQRTELCLQSDFFFINCENYTDHMTPYGILFTRNVFPLQAL